MVSYVIRRLLAMIPALLGIATITFLLMHLTPGGPFSSEHSDPLVQRAQLHAYHLDEPIWPTFVGSTAGLWKTLVLVLTLVTFGLGIFFRVRKIGAETPLPPALIGIGVALGLWYMLMVTQLPGTPPNSGFVPGQFFNYLGNLLHGDLGVSLSFRGQTVNDIIGRSANNSLVLGLAAFVLLV